MRTDRSRIPRRRPRPLTAALVALVAFGSMATACGGDDQATGAGAGTTAASSAKAAGATTTAAAKAAGPATTQKNGEKSMSKPTVSVPSGEAPTTLVKEDLIAGTGAEATKGRTVSVHYVGVLFSDGKQFDASWDRNEPFVFRLGAGQVIGGWDQGVEGMKVGGRRQLVIPPALGYGSRGAPPVIGPNATLVFVVDLLAVQ